MIQVQVINEKEVARRLHRMPEKVPKTIRLAVNDTARKARSRIGKKAQETYTVKISGMNRALNMTPATNSDLIAKLRASGEKLSASKFSTRAGTLGSEKYFNPTIKRWQTGKGGQGAGIQLLKSGSIKRGSNPPNKWFKTKVGKGGHNGVFSRSGSGRLPIKEKMGLSIPQMLGSEKHVYGILEPHIQSDLNKALNRHIARAIRGDF